MSNMPKVSVIAAFYNVEAFADKCIRSICEQDLEDIEIILIDDGSVDRSGDICDEYALKDPRITVIHQENQGLSAVRNKGIAVAKGEYIGFVDGDDFINKKMYSEMYRIITENNADIAVCAREVVKEYEINDSKDFFEEQEPEEITVFNSTEALKEMFEYKKFWVEAWDKLYKKELFEGILYPEGKTREGVYTTYKIFDKAHKVVYTNQKLYAYVQRKGSIVHATFSKRNFDGLYAYDEMIPHFRNAEEELKKKLYYRCYVKSKIVLEEICAGDLSLDSFKYFDEYRDYVIDHKQYFLEADLDEEEIKHINNVINLGYAYFLKYRYRESTPKTVFHCIRRKLTNR